MSELKHIISIEPPAYEQIREQFTLRNYICPKCDGKGGFQETESHNHDRFIECDYCEGTGKVKAEVMIKWGADEG